MSAPAPLQVAAAPQPPFSVAQSAGAQLKPEPCQCGARQTQVDARCVSTQVACRSQSAAPPAAHWSISTQVPSWCMYPAGQTRGLLWQDAVTTAINRASRRALREPGGLEGQHGAGFTMSPP